MTRSRQQDDEGFTLIELLIVIVILGVLAGIVVFAVGGINDRGDSSACKQDKRTIETAIEAYQTQQGGYPDSLEDLVDKGYLRPDPAISADTKSIPGSYELSYEDGTLTADCSAPPDGSDDLESPAEPGGPGGPGGPRGPGAPGGPGGPGRG